VHAGSATHEFSVWIAADAPSRERGLMFVRELPPDRGMLFLFEFPQPLAFWMKNTYVSLDMIFIRADGRIAKIVANTKPLSKDIIPSGVPVLAVLEVAGGTARKLGIEPGDRVANPIFQRH
jgi:uncharacterized membrane protein (UPF0127 family)